MSLLRDSNCTCGMPTMSSPLPSIRCSCCCIKVMSISCIGRRFFNCVREYSVRLHLCAIGIMMNISITKVHFRTGLYSAVRVGLRIRGAVDLLVQVEPYKVRRISSDCRPAILAIYTEKTVVKQTKTTKICSTLRPPNR